MKKIGINYRSKLGTVLIEGERLELKIDRMIFSTIGLIQNGLTEKMESMQSQQ